MFQYDVPDDDFSPAVALICLLFFGVMLVLIGIGIVVGIACVICGAILVALGIVSTSVLTALLRRKVSTGLLMLHYQCVTLGATMSGSAVAWVGAGLLQLPIRQRYVVLFGAMGGATAGMLLAFATDYARRMACRRLMTTLITPEKFHPGP